MFSVYGTVMGLFFGIIPAMKQTTVEIGIFAAAVVALAGCITQTPNAITDAEKEEGWVLLFDGKNLPSDQETRKKSNK